jgi:hypothetical protein
MIESVLFPYWLCGKVSSRIIRGGALFTLEIEEDEVTKIKILSCARQNGLICIGARGEAQARVRNESSHALPRCLWCNCAAGIMANNGVDGISHTHLLASSHDLAQ